MEEFFATSKSVAIFGGSFNPIHIGHIGIARFVYESFPDLDHVIFLPNAKTYYKQSGHGVSDEDRLAMLKLAVRELPWASVSLLEMERGGYTYTVDTLREILSVNPGLDIKFMIGADSLMYIDSWREAGEILSSVEILTAVRQTGADVLLKKKAELEAFCPNARITLLQTPEYEISSTEIRNKAACGEDLSGLVPASVADYIKTHELYR